MHSSEFDICQVIWSTNFILYGIFTLYYVRITFVRGMPRALLYIQLQLSKFSSLKNVMIFLPEKQVWGNWNKYKSFVGILKYGMYMHDGIILSSTGISYGFDSCIS